MTEDELPTHHAPVHVTLHRTHGLQRFRLPASALQIRVVAGVLQVMAAGTATTHPAGSLLHIPSATPVRLEPHTAQAELDLWCAPPGPEQVLKVLADPSTESTTRLAYAADGGVELLLDPMPMWPPR